MNNGVPILDGQMFFFSNDMVNVDFSKSAKTARRIIFMQCDRIYIRFCVICQYIQHTEHLVATYHVAMSKVQIVW